MVKTTDFDSVNSSSSLDIPANNAHMSERVDDTDLKSVAFERTGSSPVVGTKYLKWRNEMFHPGIGSMLHYLSGGSKHDPSEYYGKMIKSVTMTEDKISLAFADDKIISIWDNGQSCCEHRYMTTDDDIQSLVGNALVRIETKDAPNIVDGWGEHEQVFVEIATDKGFIIIVNHNEHNGYYGGFGLTITEDGE